MPTLDGFAAVSSALARATNVPGSCLNTVWQSYGSHPSIGPHAGQYPDAIDGWRYATKQHPSDTNPPAGYPVYFDALTRPRYAGDDNYASGDVVISIGGGLVRCTDGAGAGRMGTMTIAQRAAQIGRPYLGWTEDFLGYDVVTATTASLGTASPLGGFLMALSDSEQTELLTKTRSLFDAVFNGGSSMPDGTKSIAASLADIHAIVGQGVRRGDKVIPQIQDDADTRTIVGEIQAELENLTSAPVAINYDELAAAVAKAAGGSPSADAVAAAVVKLLGGKLSA